MWSRLVVTLAFLPLVSVVSLTMFERSAHCETDHVGIRATVWGYRMYQGDTLGASAKPVWDGFQVMGLPNL